MGISDEKINIMRKINVLVIPGLLIGAAFGILLYIFFNYPLGISIAVCSGLGLGVTYLNPINRIEKLLKKWKKARGNN